MDPNILPHCYEEMRYQLWLLERQAEKEKIIQDVSTQSEWHKQGPATLFHTLIGVSRESKIFSISVFKIRIFVFRICP